MSIRIATNASRVDTDLALVQDDADDVVYLQGNNVKLLWFDENDGTVNFCTVQEHTQELLPGLKFTEDNKLKVYED